MSLLARLILATALIGAIMMGVSAVALVGNAKRAIELEVNAGRALARDYVIAAVGSLMRSNKPEEAVAFLPGTLFQPRHVRIAVIDRVNSITHFPRPPRQDDDDGAPDWFVRLLAPPEQELQLPIRVGPDTFGTVIITTSPEDEINEIWEDFRVLAMIGGGTYLGTLLVLALVLRTALRPLTWMSHTFSTLEDGDFSARIGDVPTPEFAVLAERFDRLADTVEHTLAEKDALNRRLVELQDAERRTIAMELHDEFGPCLFGMRVEARAIRDRAAAIGDQALSDRATNVLDIVEQIQTANRQLLARLRPMEIGQMPLSQVLNDLVERLRQFAPDLTWSLSISDAFDDRLSEAEELHIYRITQEAITNTLRHADARTLKLSLRHAPKAQDVIHLEIKDDGRGWAGQTGSGIRGMQERARSLGGRVDIDREDGWTVVSVALPLVA